MIAMYKKFLHVNSAVNAGNLLSFLHDYMSAIVGAGWLDVVFFFYLIIGNAADIIYMNVNRRYCAY